MSDVCQVNRQHIINTRPLSMLPCVDSYAQSYERVSNLIRSISLTSLTALMVRTERCYLIHHIQQA